MRALAVALFTTCASASSAFGQDSISTDRPGFLYSPTVVPRGRLQFEAGLPTLNLVRESGDEFRSWSAPIAMRCGLTEQFELRASLPTWTRARFEDGSGVETDEGFGDTEIGAKFAVSRAPASPLALQCSLHIPSGEDGFSTGEWGGSAYLLKGDDLGDSCFLQTMLGVTYSPVSGADDSTAGAVAALLSHPIADRCSGYVEATAFPGLQHAAGQSYLGAALIWQPSSSLQFDLSADFGLDDDSADVIASLGMSWRP